MNGPFLKYCRANWQYLLNIYLFLNFLGWTLFQGYRLYTADRFYYSEVSFLVQNIVLTGIVIMRRPHRAIEKNIFSQLVATVAFFSGAAFMGQAPTGNHAAELSSEIIMIISNVLGIVTLLALGRSFGILIAVREVKSEGVYSIIRHPMYFTDILLRIGMVINHLNPFTAVMLVFSSLCYVYRAILEEKFLGRFQEYREYMARVRYRFIPYIF
jgi:protein-S-isoprenylcysteine O-methyltransferase Ste14